MLVILVSCMGKLNLQSLASDLRRFLRLVQVSVPSLSCHQHVRTCLVVSFGDATTRPDPHGHFHRLRLASGDELCVACVSKHPTPPIGCPTNHADFCRKTCGGIERQQSIFGSEISRRCCRISCLLQQPKQRRRCVLRGGHLS